ncbi:class II D-tagatose-bisphosphate aldolase non-catalytic subunit [Aureimonas leprariae]|uniref:Class II D-tagatose-bisphosphate aldolase, non-catalytic subunit n=1 Tax=Plantimonas leprariae TaxID=2615207 RepID=A0A7V7TYF9_9HYPH|nr:class II D-tagatose-bisphosphate aldolase, non-catalytic subunit [Aureimonas leprariae]KAB0682937.1 class II D-tagatose-bisphosphate aldolase, non-catalytic subunit [Aureimonas leprariae]
MSENGIAAADVFAEGLRRNAADGGFSFASVCSAHPDVLAASLRLARERAVPIVVEATSNQVNQFGGYTGMTPADFIAAVGRIAAEVGANLETVVFGGDHLGPQAWRAEPAEAAMAKAADMMRAYVEAGFTKIHLDCSEGCAGEDPQVGDALAAERAAILAEACERAAPAPERLSYIVGTEVPPPGGARAEHAEAIRPTEPDAARATLLAHNQAFAARGLGAAWDRVRGLVVQPGLEFAPDHVDRFDLQVPDRLSPVLRDWPRIAFEAHSTDYQEPAVFPELARRRFAVLKVGPALTYAYRSAVYALSHIDGWTTGEPHLSELMERLMVEAPGHWRKHYEGDAATLRTLRHFGYADRIRYYWALPDAREAVAALEARIDAAKFPDPLVEQYFAAGEIARAATLRSAAGLGRAKALIHARIETALEPYLFRSSAR